MARCLDEPVLVGRVERDGEETSRHARLPVVLAQDGDRNWVLNARAAGWVELRRGHRRERLCVRELHPRAAVPVLREYYRLGRLTRPFFEVSLDSSDEAWLLEAPRHPVFGLEPVEP